MSAGFLAFEKRQGDNAWLDLLRAVAISLVLLRHGYVAVSPAHADPGFLGYLALNGWVGVDLFFVLSGYLISLHLMRSGFGTSAFSYRRYLSLRALRILPAYFAVIAMILASAFPLYRIDDHQLGWRTAYHLLLLQDYLPANFNVAFWSLGVEEKFYLLAPFLLWLLFRQKTLGARVFILLLFFAVPAAIRVGTYFAQAHPLDYATFFRTLRSPFHTSLDSLLVGVAIAIADRSGAIRLKAWQATAIFVGSGSVLVLWLGSQDFMGTINLMDVVPQPELIAALCGLLLMGAIRMPALNTSIEPITRVLARLSYVLYLAHIPLIPLAKAIARQSPVPVPTFWLIFLSLSLLVACLVHYSVEKPFLLLKDNWAKHRFKPRSSAIPVTP